jgi:hypothetical protein
MDRWGYYAASKPLQQKQEQELEQLHSGKDSMHIARTPGGTPMLSI